MKHAIIMLSVKHKDARFILIYVYSDAYALNSRAMPASL